MENKISFEQWFKELKEVAIKKYQFTQEAVDTFDDEAWEFGYYSEGLTPEQALIEDLKNAM